MTAWRFILRNPLAYRKIAFASFIGYAFSTNIGFSMIAGSSVRYRLYSSWGLSAIDIPRSLPLHSGLWLGLGAVAGVMFLIEPLRFLHCFISLLSIQPWECSFLYWWRDIFCRVLGEETAKNSGWEFSLPP